MTTRIIGGLEAKTITPQQKWELLSPYLKQFGSGCMAYSTLQPGMEYFLIEGAGYIAYQNYSWLGLKSLSTRIVLSSPIVQPKRRLELLREFLKGGQETTFLQLDKDSSRCLNDSFSIEANQMGIETEIDTTDFDTRGKDKSQLRHWINTARKAGVEVFEAPITSLDRNQVRSVSDDWLNRKGGEEARILTRPLVYEDEPDVRYFWAKKEGKIIGVVGFDPMYSNGEVFSYYHNVVRLLEDAPNGTSDVVTTEAIKKFGREGIKMISLGMSPLCNLEDDGELKFSLSLRNMFRFMYEDCNYMYPFKGNHFHKEKYRGKEKKVYFLNTEKNSPRKVITALKALNLPIFPKIM